MPREVKQDRHAGREGSTPAVARHLRASTLSSPSPRPGTPRWFPPAGAELLPAPPPARTPIAAASLLAVAALLALAVPITAVRVALPIVLLTAAAVLLGRGRNAPSSAPEAPRPARSIRLDDAELTFEGREPVTLLAFEDPFGVTLLATPRRDRVIALLTSSRGTYYLGAELDEAARRAHAPMLDRALTVTTDDAGLEAIGPDGEALILAPEQLAAVVAALVEKSPACLDRFVLTDARGAPLALDGRHLSVGDRAVDLTAPLEWRPLVFQEAFGSAVAVYQGTWVRQGGTELVLVSLLPSIGPPPGADLDLATVDRAVLRDLRLMQALPEQPPPAEQRVAIERLFMLPLRSALDRAPRAAHRPNRAQA